MSAAKIDANGGRPNSPDEEIYEDEAYTADEWSFIYNGLNEINYYDESIEEKYKGEAYEYYYEENEQSLMWNGLNETYIYDESDEKNDGKAAEDDDDENVIIASKLKESLAEATTTISQPRFLASLRRGIRRFVRICVVE